ncbi:hypothetical protein Tcan_10505 [Toxocara canis]|uniref:Uncharacterized protein n=1 Tax=Toxocara canis TaxID=6265 RepID=A0A0B2V7Z7_TOXCA|nr:hypothetical protein Tcan_10505 [Toxocara canis]
MAVQFVLIVRQRISSLVALGNLKSFVDVNSWVRWTPVQLRVNVVTNATSPLLCATIEQMHDDSFMSNGCSNADRGVAERLTQ